MLDLWISIRVKVIISLGVVSLFVGGSYWYNDYTTKLYTSNDGLYLSYWASYKTDLTKIEKEAVEKYALNQGETIVIYTEKMFYFFIPLFDSCIIKEGTMNDFLDEQVKSMNWKESSLPL